MDKRIIALFETQEEVENAVKTLEDHSYGRAVTEILDRSRLHAEPEAVTVAPPVVAAPAPGSGSSSTAYLAPITPAEPTNSFASRLRELDVPEDEAHFLSRAVEGTGAVVVLTAEHEDEAEQIRALLENAGATKII